MGYFSCNAESAISTCDPYNWDRKIRKKRTNTKKPNNNNNINNKPIKIREFTYAELVTATNGFSADSFLGKGSHGTVYKASLDNGKLIAAVKKTTSHSNTNYNNCNNFNLTAPADNEIEILSRVQHPRLVNLIGFCVDPKERKLLVVEYMPNGSLYDLLHSTTSRPPGWTRRVRFALQVAKAVQFLHSSNPPVIHRDIKSPNVLIDEDRNARLGDFGLALRGHVEDVRVKCTPPAGTLGYLDPGYLAPSDLSAKSDVFSFGILLLEIISGRNAIDVNFSPPSIVDWAIPLIKRGDFAEICDSRVGFPADQALIRNLAVLAARCVRSTAQKRPEMLEVVEGLKAVRKRVHAPHLWVQLRRRVGRVVVEESRGPENVVVSDGVEEVVRVGSGRRNRKVSSVSGVAYGSEPMCSVGDRVIRSKSIGSFGEIKMGSDYYCYRRMKTGGVAVKMPVVKLSKSRSMGVLHGPRLARYTSDKVNRRFMYDFGRETHESEIDDETMSKLLYFGLDEKSEKLMQEKPLVGV